MHFVLDLGPVSSHHIHLSSLFTHSGVPVVITYRTYAKMASTFKKRGYSDEEIEAKLKRNRENLEAAISKYPDRIHLADTTLWSDEPNTVMEGVFQFLGLTWRPEYLNMDAVNVKRVPGER